MTNAQDSWRELGDRLQSLGLKLKLHVEEESDQAADVGDSVKDGLMRVGKALEDVFEAIGDAVDDDAVRADAKEAGRLLLAAVDASFTQAGEALREKLRRP
jgi:Flp pilus assembly pilin Flp